MNKLVILLLVFISASAIGQGVTFEKAPLSDTASVAMAIQKLASDYLLENEIADQDRYQIEILAGEYQASIQTMEDLRKNSELNNGHRRYMPFELYAQAKIRQLESDVTFNEAYQSVFQSYLSQSTDEQAYSANIVFTTYDGVAQFSHAFETQYNSITNDTLDNQKASALLKAYFLFHVFTVTEPIVFREIKLDEDKRYFIKEEVIVSPRDGAELSVITARKRSADRLPAILIFTIYADASNEKQAILAATKGYAGVVATSRGKRLSKDPIEPYTHEFKDVYAVIDWVSQQEWNNGKVGMYGGSYNGFTQWASMKERVHTALKTIVPSVSAAPGIDVPMENNVFFNFPYKWIPYVTNNRFLDNASNDDRNRWNNLENSWFSSGKAFHKMDSI